MTTLRFVNLSQMAKQLPAPVTFCKELTKERDFPKPIREKRTKRRTYKWWDFKAVEGFFANRANNAKITEKDKILKALQDD